MSHYPSLETAKEARNKLNHSIRDLERRREDVEYDLTEAEALLEFTELEILKMMRPEDFERERDTREYLFENAKQDVMLHSILRKWIESYDDHITLINTGATVLKGGEVEYHAELLLHLDKTETSLRPIAAAIDKMSLLFAGNRELVVRLDTEDSYVLLVKNATASLYKEKAVRDEVFSGFRTIEALEYIVKNIV